MEIKNVFIGQADVPNKNGRTYPMETMQRIVDQGKGPVLGMMGMSMFGETHVDLEKVTHKITNIRIEGDKLLGDALVLETPMGKEMKRILAAGVQMDFRLAGTCQISPDGVVSEYRLISVNAVMDGA